LRACLGSWAVLCWLDGTGPAAARVDAVMPARPLMNWINVGEVAYVLERRIGAERAWRLLRELEGRLTLEVPSEDRVLAAARITARWPLASADAFAVATAVGHGATLLTGDPEIVNGDPAWPVEDLRS
jgi:predicted nucleic acid-binding protein